MENELRAYKSNFEKWLETLNKAGWCCRLVFAYIQIDLDVCYVLPPVVLEGKSKSIHKKSEQPIKVSFAPLATVDGIEYFWG